MFLLLLTTDNCNPAWQSEQIRGHMGVANSKHTLTLKSLQQKRLPPTSVYDKNYFQNQ